MPLERFDPPGLVDDLDATQKQAWSDWVGSQLDVVRDRDGSEIGWGTALLRLVGLWIAALVFYIGFIWVFIDQRRRGWHDLIAGTVVVKQP